MNPLIPTSLRKACAEYNQMHLLKPIDEGKLSDFQVEEFVKDLLNIDLGALSSIYKRVTSDDDKDIVGELSPLDSFDMIDQTKEEVISKWKQCGLDAIAKGKVGAVLLSGGQGTRLGFSGPKGMYDIGLPSQKSLFQLFAERIVALERLSGSTKAGLLPWYIMTSELNDRATREYFAKCSYFGLQESQVFFLLQGTLPCLSFSGEILVENTGKIARGPDGNGGIYNALFRSGAMADMEKRGVEYLHVFGVDNALCRVADPVFMGYCIDRNADCGNKVVWKNSPQESVGVVAKRGGNVCVVEYSELDRDTASLIDERTGKLAYGAGNICNHFFTTSFLKDSVLPNLSMMKYHVARKKIPNTGVEGMKLESFIFDVFPLSKRMAVLAVSREDEFSPVKNAPGSKEDSPDTARELLSAQAKRWIIQAGGKIQDGAVGICEVSPLVSYAGEGDKLQDLVNGRVFDVPPAL